ncbi:MAG: PhoPQ-activated pathogenicity-like protein PqaA type [Flavobacteriales bacterium]|nr:PhoPQ-activated pathogenicity-like protein PqaA type [Flavobacteriales bacterium]
MSRKKILLVFFLVLVYFTLNYAFLSVEGYTSMKDYIDSTKNEFSYEIEDVFYEDEWTGYHIRMTSGEWLDSKKVENVDWLHYVDIVIPKETQTDTGIMFIDSGVNDENYFRLDSTSVSYALRTKSVIVNIHNIPAQPVNFLASDQESFYEDDLIAYAWNKFLEGGAKQKDIEWLPRLPMTRAVVRSMDLAQEITLQNNVNVKDFVVSGASKRGWTAWTTAAVDDRVVAVVPMVIDMLNMVPSFENHYRSYGEFSPAVESYVNYNIQDWMETDEFKKLMSYVEPYYFKEKFTMPKYLINAGSDEFFSTDSWRFYYDELPGDKLLRYVPNTNHSLNGRYLNDDLISYFYRIINDIDMPTLKWELNDNNLNVALDYEGNYNVSIWNAKNQNGRDFRLWQEGELWQKINIQKSNDNNYQVEIKDKSNGYEAIMMEFTIDPESEFPLIISTGPFVIPESYPFNKYEPLK